MQCPDMIVSCKSAPIFIHVIFRICLLSATAANSLTNSLSRKEGTVTGQMYP